MANEITVSLTASVSNGYYGATVAQKSRQFTQTTAGGGNPGIVSALTTATTISFTGLTGRGMCFIENLGPTNYVEVGADNAGTFVPTFKLKVGEFAWGRFATGTIQLKANTATVSVLVYTLED